MKKLLALVAMASCIAAFASVTNIVYHPKVSYTYKPTVVTNGYTEVYSGNVLITNKVIKSIRQLWEGGKLVKKTNMVDVVVGGSVTSRVYDVTTSYTVVPEYTIVAVTNIVNGL